MKNRPKPSLYQVRSSCPGAKTVINIRYGFRWRPDNGKRVERALLIDTGADTLVLPGSMIAALGIAESGLRKRRVQTANGQVQARIGKLPGLWLGDQKVADVEVAFLEDDKLGSSGLLGMNVLSRYQMTIDDEHDKLTLIRR